ncbi:MAG: hypothetical protein GXO43_03225 [Crenarchaeota archaeon]|nr:hypothetical protein [Thermoproteota archaeon]
MSGSYYLSISIKADSDYDVPIPSDKVLSKVEITTTGVIKVTINNGYPVTVNPDEILRLEDIDAKKITIRAITDSDIEITGWVK